MVNIPFLPPKTFKLKAIIDRNGNGKWDTGNYLKGLQPEEVVNYFQNITIRSNWEIELIWKIE
jgi:hypothetical protein